MCGSSATAQDLAALLTGDHVTLLPWARGIYGRDDLYHLWRLMEQAGHAGKLFYLQPVAHEAACGDLIAFVEAFRDRLLLLVLHAGQLAGAVWFDEVTPSRACIGLFGTRAVYGAPMREAVRLAVQYGFGRYGWRAIWGFSPWHAALRIGLDTGFTHVATLPGFLCLGGTPTDVFVLKQENPAHASDRR